ncbi:hypothetical protein D1BOALGB6SA_8794 [Olavius sp. associated proteobacterium Delta 1]|nr:hypothetical protein D1BOALGB6SA_8794 [Olavius sp. associated proteobacterium Delta 1]
MGGPPPYAPLKRFLTILYSPPAQPWESAETARKNGIL